MAKIADFGLGFALITCAVVAVLPLKKPVKQPVQDIESIKADQNFSADMHASDVTATGQQDAYDIKAVEAVRGSQFGKNDYQQICNHKLGDFTFSAQGNDAMQLSVEGVQCRRGVSTMRVSVMMAEQSDTIYRLVYVRTENAQNARPDITSFDPTIGGLSL